MNKFEQSIAREAEDYPELRDLHAGERRRFIARAMNHVRRRRPYWLFSLTVMAPGVVLILLATRETFQIRHGHWLAWVAAAYGALVVLGAPRLSRWLFRRSLRDVMRQRDLRPSVCFRCGRDLRAIVTGVCPGCGEKIGRKDTTLVRVGQTRHAPSSQETAPPRR